MSTNAYYFITGLCMQGNKGGPAIALSLANAIKRHIPDAKFIFAVPGGAEFEHEQIWAKRYGYEVVESLDLRHLVPPFSFRSSRIKRLLRWIRALRKSKAMIQMSAISYIGPPALHLKITSLLSDRFMDFCMARLCFRPMLAWTQSYGPLSTKLIRFLATMDLKCQPIIFCRGDDCLSEVRAMLPHKEARSYPDIAITLPFDRVWATNYLEKHGISVQKFVSISPSAVIYEMYQRNGERNLHIEHLKNICLRLREQGLAVLIVPHTFRPGRHDPASCDFGTSTVLMSELESVSGIHLVEDDLSPVELKSLISLAYFHIGARYHSVVAALSSGVPAISISWHPKYKDLMRAYGTEDFVIEDISTFPRALVENMLANRHELAKQIKDAHKQVEELAIENAEVFAGLLPQ